MYELESNVKRRASRQRQTCNLSTRAGEGYFVEKGTLEEMEGIKRVDGKVNIRN